MKRLYNLTNEQMYKVFEEVQKSYIIEDFKIIAKEEWYEKYPFTEKDFENMYFEYMNKSDGEIGSTDLMERIIDKYIEDMEW